MIQDIQYLLESNVYVKAVFIVVAFFLLSKLFLWVCEKIILRLTKKTQTTIDDELLEKSHKPMSFLLIFIGVRLGLIPLGVTNWIYNINESCIVIAAAYLGGSILHVLIKHIGGKVVGRTKSHLDDEILRLFHKVVSVIIVIVASLIVLSLWGVEIMPFLASLGIAGIAIAFALQNTLSNIFGGISIIFDNSFKVGDIVKLDSGESGIVRDIGIRSTKLKTWDNEIITIPNGKMADSKVTNISQPDPSSRITIEVGIEYGSDIDKVKKILIDSVKDLKHVLSDPKPNALFMDMGDFALKFKLMFNVDDISNKIVVHQEAITAVYKNLNKAKIKIPYPTTRMIQERK
jgi:MscS family membrane protein